MLNITANIIVPIIAGLIFIGLAKYALYLIPLRTLVTGARTYKNAALGFLCFGVFLITRPLQILLGPHPMPLIINNIREFIMIGIFAPAVFVAMMNWAFGMEKISKKFVVFSFVCGLTLSIIFMAANTLAIGGSEEIFRIGSYPAYDGLWFKSSDFSAKAYMSVLFAVRLVDPVFILLFAAIVLFWAAKTYPENKRQFYSNMPLKYLLTGLGCLAYSLSMLSAGFLYLFGDIPNQWWMYYLGATAAGILEAVSLYLPVTKKVNL
jgi:two-component system response regulator YesN